MCTSFLLSSQFFSKLIKLETDLLSKKYTAETLDELAQCYADAVEYYDSIKDNISSYFIYKIQDMLATKKSLKLLIQENAIAKANNSLVVNTDLKDVKDSNEHAIIAHQNSKGTGLPPPILPAANTIMETLETSEDDDDWEDEQKFNKKTEGLRKTRTRKQSFNTLKTVKQKIFAHTMNMENQKKSEKQNLTNTLNTFGHSVQSNDNVVKGDIDVQKSRIQERVAKKRTESMMKSVMNYTQNSIFLQQPMTPMANKKIEFGNMENLLNELDDQESIKSFGYNEHGLTSQKSLFNGNNEDDHGKNEEKSSKERIDEIKVEQEQEEIHVEQEEVKVVPVEVNVAQEEVTANE